jgi:hypothetical protein
LANRRRRRLKTASTGQSHVVERDATLALPNAALGLRHTLPLVDGIVYSTAHQWRALI